MKALKSIGSVRWSATEGPTLEDGQIESIEIPLKGDRFRVVVNYADDEDNELWVEVYQRDGKKWECLNGISIIFDELKRKPK